MSSLSSRGALAEVRALHTDLAAELLDGLAAAELDRDLDAETLVVAEELARVPWSMGEHQRRSLALLVVATLLVTRAGSTRLPVEGGSGGFLGKLIRDLAASAKIKANVLATLADIRELTAARSLDRIVGVPGERLPLISAHGCLYLHRHYASEARLVRKLGSLCENSPSDRLGPTADELAIAMSDVAASSSFELSDEQKAAVILGCEGPLAVISGGPGTGKTAIVVAMLRVLVRSGVDVSRIAIAAPTGKAAQRLTESIHASLATLTSQDKPDATLKETLVGAMTVHRLLRFSPRSGRFGYHQNRPLPASVLIVDEASMLDLELMDGLVTALGPQTQLVLLGDADQLPSVEAGAVLRELVLAGSSAPVPGGRAFASRLTHSYRMKETNPGGRSILLAAAAVRRGTSKGLVGPKGVFRVGDGIEALAGIGAELCETSSAAEAAEFAAWWHKRMQASEPEFESLSGRVYKISVDPDAEHGSFSKSDSARIERVFAVFEAGRLVTAMRRSDSGCEAINSVLHRQVIARTSLSAETAFYPGEPILVRRNDYQRDLFNGEHGVILRVADGTEEAGSRAHQFRAVFRQRAGGFRSFALDALRGSIELAFAITVHQSQGTEADSVALILPTKPQPLLSRELVYTAITRARQWAVVCGSRTVLRTAVSRATERFSGIAQGLAQFQSES